MPFMRVDPPLTFNQYQNRAKTTDLYPHVNTGAALIDFTERTKILEYRALCLCGEVGELANKVKKLRRDTKWEQTWEEIDADFDEKRKAIAHELGDMLWYMATICDILGIDLNDVALDNLNMLAERMANDKIKGSGDNR